MSSLFNQGGLKVKVTMTKILCVYYEDLIKKIICNGSHLNL